MNVITYNVSEFINTKTINEERQGESPHPAILLMKCSFKKSQTCYFTQWAGHACHTAWPLKFNRSYKPYTDGKRKLIQCCLIPTCTPWYEGPPTLNLPSFTNTTHSKSFMICMSGIHKHWKTGKSFTLGGTAARVHKGKF